MYSRVADFKKLFPGLGACSLENVFEEGKWLRTLVSAQRLVVNLRIYNQANEKDEVEGLKEYKVVSREAIENLNSGTVSTKKSSPMEL